MAAVAQLDPPWFNDVVHDDQKSADGLVRRHTWGHDRFFHIRLRDEAQAPIYVDTGLICAHWDTEHQRPYIIPPDAPCFQRPPEGESFVPFLEPNGAVNWTRMLAPSNNTEMANFRGYIEWQQAQRLTDNLPIDRLKMVS